MEYSFNHRLLLLDVGGVLLTNGWDHESRELAAETFRLDLKEFNKRHDLIFPIYEIGKLSLAQYLDYTVFYSPRVFDQHTFQMFIFEQSQTLPGLLDYLKELKHKRSIRIGLLSNEGKELACYRINKFALDEAADFMIFSGQVGLRKPDPDIYRLAFHLSNASPQNTLYLDDRLGMVDFGATLGLLSHQHLAFESTKTLIENFLAAGEL